MSKKRVFGPLGPADWASAALLGLGLLQSAGWLLGSDSLRGLGAMSAASPLPFVFSSFRGVETFAQDFELLLTRRDGHRSSYRLTPELYARLDGPYNRRNAYGAVMAYGPALQRPEERRWVESVLGHGLCHGGPLARRFGETQALERVLVRVSSKTTGGRGDVFIEVRCSE